jgi:hypothetical protein
VSLVELTDGRGKRGWGWSLSRITRPRASLVLYKSFNTHCFSDIFLFFCLDLKNKAVEPMLVRLHGQVQARIDAMSSTKSKVEQMSQIGRRVNHDDKIFFIDNVPFQILFIATGD